ncbi:permease [Okibacterium endophyticum]
MTSSTSHIDESPVPDASDTLDARSLTRVRSRRPGRRWLVLAAMTIALFVTIRIVASSFEWDIAPAVQDFFTLSISVVIESLPFVFLGIVLSTVVQVWLPENFLLRRLPRSPLLRRFVLSLLGVLFPVCECGNMPLARGLMLRGLSVSDSITFLLAAPILNPVTIITTYQAFGWEDGILVSRILGGLVIANLVGAIISVHPTPQKLITPSFQAACDAQGHGHGADSKMQRSARSFAEETSAMLPALFIGSGIAGAIQVGIHRDVLSALGSNPLWSVVALLLLAFIVSICSSVDAFFILSLGSTFMPGGIVAFLVFGPMIDIKMLSLMRTTYTTRTLAVVTAIVALCALVLGLVVNLSA